MSADKRREVDEPMADVAEPDVSDSFGTWLRRQREGRQIALREIADSSKISLRYLQALEADRFEVLPAAVFAKGFLRQYARYVGLDPEDVINFYLSARQAQDLEADAPEEITLRSSSGGLFSGWKLLALIVVLLGIVALLFHLAERRTVSSESISNTASSGTGSLQETPPSVVSSSEPAASTVGDVAARSGAEPAGAATAGPKTPGAAPSLDDPPSISVLSSPASSTAPIWVKLDFRRECWVQVRTDGRRALSETKVQGESVDLEAERSVELTFGDGGAVTVEVNGFPFLFDATPGRVVRLTIDEATVRGLGSGAGP